MPEVTKLTPLEEALFQRWVKENGISDVDSPDAFYDYRGFFQQNGPKPVKFGVDHFPDTFKQHGHPTFSIESKYSKGPWDGGMWAGDNYVPEMKPVPSHTPTKQKK